MEGKKNDTALREAQEIASSMIQAAYRSWQRQVEEADRRHWAEIECARENDRLWRPPARLQQ